MSLVSDARADLASDLAAVLDIPCHVAPPAPFHAPCAVINEIPTDFVTWQTFGVPSLTWQVYIFARPGSNTAMIRELDDYVSVLIEEYPGASIDGYSSIQAEGTSLLTCIATITT